MAKESQDADLEEERSFPETEPPTTEDIRDQQIENARKKLNALEKAYDQCGDEVGFSRLVQRSL